jgi:hypothetical protein
MTKPLAEPCFGPGVYVNRLAPKSDGKHGHPGISDFPAIEKCSFLVIIPCTGRAEV